MANVNTMNEDAATRDILCKIDREKAIINAAHQMQQATHNALVKSRAEAQIRDAKRNLIYFEQTLSDLRSRTLSGDTNQPSVSSNEGSPSPLPLLANIHQFFSGPIDGTEQGSDVDVYSGPGDRSSMTRPNYSQLDLLKYNTSHLGPQIQFMLPHLRFKLSMEKQYKDGMEKMLKLYEIEGDRKSIKETQQQLKESHQKIHLLKRAMRKYEDLNVHNVHTAQSTGDERLNKPSQRKPLTGNLYIKIHEVADVEHAASGQSTRGPEKLIAIKIDHALKGKTKATGPNRSIDEQYEFNVEKANDIEFLVYEKSSSDTLLLLGFIWIRIWDLVDEIHQQRMRCESQQVRRTIAKNTEGSKVQSDFPFLSLPHPSSAVSGTGGAADAAVGNSGGSRLAFPANPTRVDAWFSLEPVGRIHLTLDFNKQVKDREPFAVGLDRKGAVRQKKKEVIERYGHRFTLETFYAILCCALCGDLLKYTAGMQCADCKYTCHQKCYHKVVIRCMSNLNAATHPDEEMINHRIPHRFQAFSNMGANWCCHCGQLLPISRSQSRKCIECKLTCHSNCVPFVPDFCGMSMDCANTLLAEMKMTKMSRMLENIHEQERISQFAHCQPKPTSNNSSLVITANSQVEVSQSDIAWPEVIVPQEAEHILAYHDPRSQASPHSTQDQGRPANYVTPPVVRHRKAASSATRAGTQGTMGLEDFNFLAVLGRGNFGKVMLAEAKATKQLFAIKTLKKDFIIENDEFESIRSERRMFLLANRSRHPFLYSLHACFQTESRIYFVMEYISGGDLMLHIQRGPFGIKRTRFYAAEVCLAIKFFHEHGIVYRDLKLDNILLAPDGHIKIADFGLCKENMWHGSTTNTFCGTFEFMAPEILLEQGYGRAVDWWAYGVLIYQMLLQQSPFRGEDEEEISGAILADEPLYPIHMPGDSVSILQGLLTRQPDLRLGSGPTDAQEIMGHAFFRSIAWEDMYYKRIPVPYLPVVKNDADVSNFDSEFTSVEPALTPVQSVISLAMQEEFHDFSYSTDIF